MAAPAELLNDRDRGPVASEVVPAPKGKKDQRLFRTASLLERLAKGLAGEPRRPPPVVGALFSSLVTLHATNSGPVSRAAALSGTAVAFAGKADGVSSAAICV